MTGMPGRELQVYLAPPLSGAVGQQIVTVSLPPEACIGDLLAELVRRFGGKVDRLLFTPEHHTLAEHWTFMLDDKCYFANRPHILDVSLAGCGTVSILLPLAGGH